MKARVGQLSFDGAEYMQQVGRDAPPPPRV
jgi:hypothetical protein